MSPAGDRTKHSIECRGKPLHTHWKRMNKALERPLKWHQEKFYAMREQQVKCYLLFQMTEDGEEHNRFFPYTKSGYKAAQALAKKLGQSSDRILSTTEKLKWILPYGVRSVEEYEKWCKEWGVA